MDCKCTAIVLAAGSGKRMSSDIAKQYMDLNGYPVIYYSLKAFEESFVDEIVLVTAASEIKYCQEEIVKRYCFNKITSVIAGGKERYHSVYNGLCAVSTDTDYVFIHDSARPGLTQDILERALATVKAYHVAIASMPVKDTIKIADEDGFVVSTPKRSSLYLMQTPQVFELVSIKRAYEKLISEEEKVLESGLEITDDAMVMEEFGEHPVRLCEGSYRNIKITTPEDLLIAEEYLRKID